MHRSHDERFAKASEESFICFTSYSFISGKEKNQRKDGLMGRSFQDQRDAALVVVCQKRNSVKPGGAAWMLLCRRLEYQMNTSRQTL